MTQSNPTPAATLPCPLSPATIDALIAAAAGMLGVQEAILAKGGEIAFEGSTWNTKYDYYMNVEDMSPDKAQAAANDWMQVKRKEYMEMARRQAVLLSDALTELRSLKGVGSSITDATGAKVAGPVSAGVIRRLLVTANVPAEWAEKCLAKAGVERWEDVPEDKAAKATTYLREHQKLAAAPSAAYAHSYEMYYTRAMELAQEQGADAGVAGTTVYEDAKRVGEGGDVARTTDVWRCGRLEAMEQDRYDWRTGEVITDAKAATAGV